MKKDDKNVTPESAKVDDAPKVESKKSDKAQRKYSEEEKKVASDACKDEMSDDDYIAFLETELGRHISDAEDCKKQAQRIQAEFDNYRKRTESFGEDMRKLGITAVIEKMLEVLDNCDRAREFIKDENALMGFNMMEQQIETALKAFGLKDCGIEIGNVFDVKSMHAIEREAKPEMADKVTKVFSKGYELDAKVIRPAKVAVGYAPEIKSEDASQQSDNQKQ